MENEKQNKKVDQEQFRVVLTKEANLGLESFMNEVNKNFQGGKALKSDIANFVFSNLRNLLTDADIKLIQSKCFNDKEALALLSKNEQELPDIVKKAIREAYGISETTKKRLGKVPLELSTAKNVDNLNGS